MPSDEHDDDVFTAKLAAYDAALAHGDAAAADTRDDEALRRAKTCLEQLDAIWPRARRVSGPTPMLGDTRGEPQAPQRLGRFELIRELGRGGGGIVYLAHDPVLRRQVALKLPRPESLFTPELRRRFVREAEVAARLNHRHIVPVYEAGEVDGVCYLVSAYCAGPNLAHWLRERSVAPRQAALIVAAVADGVAHMHGRGILHRDIKPTNVLLEPDEPTSGGGELGFVPRLTDFGLAKLDANAASAAGDMTCSGALIGTPAYMAPEQAEGRLDQVGPATDVHALGLLLYEMLAGRAPFRGATDVATLQQVVSVEPPPPGQRAAPADLQAVCLKCLAKRPAERYATAEALALDLSNFLDGKPTLARPLSSAQRAVKWVRRRPMAAAFAASIGLAVLCLTVGAVWFAVHEHQFNTELLRINTELAETAVREREQRDLALAQAHELRLGAYADRIERAHAACKQGRTVQAIEWLNELQPGPGQPDLRGFEWHHLKALCHPLHVVWRGHQGIVLCVVASPDGTIVASASVDYTIRLWDAATGKDLGILRGHEIAPPEALAFSPDGRTLASAGGNALAQGEVLLWNVADGRLRARNRLANAAHIQVAFSPDGKTLALSMYRGFGLWNLETGEQRAFQTMDRFAVVNVAFAPDGRAIATANHDCTVRLWDVAAGMEQCCLTGHTGAVWAVSFSPDGQTLASGGDDHTVRFWDVKKAKQKALFVHRFPGLVAFSPDGLTLASGSQLNRVEKPSQVQLWDVKTGNLLAAHKPLPDDHWSPTFLPGTRLLAFASERTIQLFDTSAPAAPTELSGHTPNETWALAFAPDGKTLASAGDDHNVRLWDMTTGDPAHVGAHNSLVAAVAYSGDDKTLASASYDGSVKLWDPFTRRLETTLEAEGDPLRCLAISADGSIVAAGTRTKKGSAEVLLWDIKAGRRLPSLGPHKKSVRSVAFSPDGALLASGSEDGIIRWWDTATWEPRGQSDDTEQVTCLAFAPDGKTLASGNLAGIVRLWDAAAGTEKMMLRGHTGEIHALAFAPDGRTLCSAGNDRTIRLWQAPTGRALTILEGHQTRVNAVAFAPDSRTLASAGHDGIIKLWRSTSPQ